jgi:hypothetical protein
LPQALPIFNDFRVSLISCSIIINSDKNELVLGVTDGVLQYHQQKKLKKNIRLRHPLFLYQYIPNRLSYYQKGYRIVSIASLRKLFN